MSSQDIEPNPQEAVEPREPEQAAEGDGTVKRRIDWKAMLGNRKNGSGYPSNRTSMSDLEHQTEKKPEKWSFGILNDTETDEVPGSILLLSKASEYNEPLGLQNAPARTSASSLPSPYLAPSQRSSFSRRRPIIPEKKRTPDGKIVLEPQPDESLNDPLNWGMWRRDLALLALGFYCMLGGGMTPILAAGFKEVAADFGVSVPRVALTTGLYMMGLGIGSVILSPTAILYGKRPVYLCAALCYIATSLWCAYSPDFTSLVIARIFMGIAVSSVECLPSATVAEIFFLHEKAYRLGIYTLLLLGGKNLVPLVSAAVIQSLHWRWVFKIVAIVVAFGFCLLFVFVPETFWDRTPRPHKHNLHRFPSRLSLFRSASATQSPVAVRRPSKTVSSKEKDEGDGGPAKRHARFRTDDGVQNEKAEVDDKTEGNLESQEDGQDQSDEKHDGKEKEAGPPKGTTAAAAKPDEQSSTVVAPTAIHPTQSATSDYFFSRGEHPTGREAGPPAVMSPISRIPTDVERQPATGESPNPYTDYYQGKPPKTFAQQLKPWSGRLNKENWFRVAFRPFVLYCYPSILWSSLVYSLSIGWLIVLSESVSTIFEKRATYNFTALQTGLVYISPFVGGVLGTAVAGKVSDKVVMYFARKNGGIYEPEFRLVMAIPIAITTTIGLMGFGWSAQERDLWIVPTVFFGLISFGCSLGSTTAITFAVDSYRQYAGEALVTLNFSKNIFHGLVFSLFFNKWLDGDGSKTTFIAIGGIQMACLLSTIPMYIYGKRARMWTVRKNLLQ